VDHFFREGHTCCVISLEPAADYACETFWLPQRPWLPRFLRYSLAIPAARRILERFQPDVVNAHFLPNYGWMAAHLDRHPWVLSVLGSDILTVPRQSPLHAWRTRWVLQHCDAVTSDAHMLSDAVRSFGFPAQRILTVPLGIELQRFPAPTPRPEPGPGVPLVVLSSRRLEPVYDVGTLLRAWQRIPRDDVPLELRVAGKGSQENELHRLSPEGQVQWLGWLTQIQLDTTLRESAIYVSTSLSDSTSVSLLEAMAAGCFPVVSDIAGNREWIQHEVNGLLFPAGDVDALAQMLSRAVHDVALRQAAVTRNRQLVEERASWADNMHAVGTLLQSLRRT
jgi:glycosyltransferase involved in cell wall biosynthesis